LLVSLEHPGLVQVLDYFEEGESQYLVMPFIDGLTLKQAVDKVPTFFAVDRVLGWANQLCDALEYLHAQDPPIIFRDLKPSNVMIDRSEKLRLIDFGIARVFQDETQTQTYIRGMGSAGYAPLEQYGGQGTDPRSDIFSLGATIYTLLTREIPPPVVAIVAGVESLKSPRTINPAIPARLERALVKMMSIRKDGRYRSIAQVRKALSMEGPATGQLTDETSVLLDTEAVPSAIGTCLAWKAVCPEGVAIEAPAAAVVTHSESHVDPFTIEIGLYPERADLRGITLIINGRPNKAPVELELQAAVVISAPGPFPSLARDKLQPRLETYISSLAREFVERFPQLPEAERVRCMPLLGELRHYRGPVGPTFSVMVEECYLKSLEMQCDDLESMRRLANLHHTSGNRHEAERILTKLVRQTQQKAGSLPDLEALELLEEALTHARRLDDSALLGRHLMLVVSLREKLNKSFARTLKEALAALARAEDVEDVLWRAALMRAREEFATGDLETTGKLARMALEAA
ncbi:MAG: serine/threonine protein kinase, partial [Candidatus Eremiobacteraeota bacterium]|nr:serine/threonine protein kinase [Candidatus Eremiobacteraeota bacterium]